MTSAHVLIVDDDVAFRSVLTELLEAEGCTVYVAENGKRALEVLEVILPDLVLVDLMMPVMNGWDFCSALERSSQLADIPLVILSGVARFGPRGRNRMIAKPIERDALAGLLDDVRSA
jgi:two-component system chemotaxis response regulator CheY